MDGRGAEGDNYTREGMIDTPSGMSVMEGRSLLHKVLARSSACSRLGLLII